MRLRRTIKHNARLALSRHWCKASSIVMILLLFSVFVRTAETFALALFKVEGFVDILSTPGISFDDIPNISPIAMAIAACCALFCFLIIEPIKLGAKSWYYQLTDGKDLPAREIFIFFFSFGRYFRALSFRVLLFIKQLFWAVIFLLIPAAAIIGGFVWEKRASRDIETLLFTGLKVSGTVSACLMFVLLLIWLNRYYLAEYILVSDSSLSPRKAIKHSVTLTSGRLWEFAVLELSLFGWRILDALILPRLYTMPYISVVQSLYARYLSELFSREQAAYNSQNAAAESEESASPEQPTPTESAVEQSAETAVEPEPQPEQPVEEPTPETAPEIERPDSSQPKSNDIKPE